MQGWLVRGFPHTTPDVLSHHSWKPFPLLCHPLPVGNASAQASEHPGIVPVTVWGGECLGWPRPGDMSCLIHRPKRVHTHLSLT